MENQTHKCKYVISYEEVEVKDTTYEGGLKKSVETVTKMKIEGTLLPIIDQIIAITEGIEYDSINMKEVVVQEGKRSFGQRGAFTISQAEYEIKFSKGWLTKFTIKVTSSTTAYKVLASKLREQLGVTVWQSKIEN